MTCGSNGTSSINIGHVVEYIEKWTSDFLTSTFFYGVQSKLFCLKPDAEGLRWTRRPEIHLE